MSRGHKFFLKEFDGNPISPFGAYTKLKPIITRTISNMLFPSYGRNKQEIIEDLVHDTFIQAHRLFHGFNPNKGSNPMSSLVTWINAVAISQVQNYFRIENTQFPLDKPHFSLEENTTAMNLESPEEFSDEDDTFNGQRLEMISNELETLNPGVPISDVLDELIYFEKDSDGKREINKNITKYARKIREHLKLPAKINFKNESKIKKLIPTDATLPYIIDNNILITKTYKFRVRMIFSKNKKRFSYCAQFDDLEEAKQALNQFRINVEAGMVDPKPNRKSKLPSSKIEKYIYCEPRISIAPKYRVFWNKKYYSGFNTLEEAREKLKELQSTIPVNPKGPRKKTRSS